MVAVGAAIVAPTSAPDGGSVAPMSDPSEPGAPEDLPPRKRSTGSVALGRVMLGLGEIIESKPPQEAYEHVVETDDTGEPFDPEDIVIEL